MLYPIRPTQYVFSLNDYQFILPIGLRGTNTNPTRMYSCPSSSNFCPFVVTKPVDAGTVAEVVDVATGVEAGSVIGWDVAVAATEVVADPGMHLDYPLA